MNELKIIETPGKVIAVSREMFLSGGATCGKFALKFEIFLDLFPYLNPSHPSVLYLDPLRDVCGMVCSCIKCLIEVPGTIIAITVKPFLLAQSDSA